MFYSNSVSLCAHMRMKDEEVVWVMLGIGAEAQTAWIIEPCVVPGG